MAYTFSLTSLFANVVSNLFFFVQLRLEKTSRAQLDSNNLDLIHNFLSPNKNLNRFTKEISLTSAIFHLLHTHKLCSNSVHYTIPSENVPEKNICRIHSYCWKVVAVAPAKSIT